MVILELIHALTPDLIERWFSLAIQTQPRFRACDDHNDSADRILRQFVRVSDLSAPVGRVLAYRGCDG